MMTTKEKKSNPLSVKAKKYDAFISYSHDADNSLAPSLQSGLHNLAKPFYKLRAIRTFRDETDLTVTPTGWADIQSALSNSRYFILLASKKSADPEGGVNKEIDFWINELNHKTNLLIVLTEGKIVWNEQQNDFDWSQTNALPNILSHYFAEEPFWADLSWAQSEQDLSLRNPEFLNVVAKLSDPIRNLDVNKLISEDHRQQKRTKRIAYSAIATLLVLLIAVSGFAWHANNQENIAIEQGNLAFSRQIAARADAIREKDGESLTTSILLAIESIFVRPTDEGQQSLQEGIKLLPSFERIDLQEKNPDSIFSANGKFLLTSTDNFVKIYAIEKDEKLQDPTIIPVKKSKSSLNQLALSPDGKYFTSFLEKSNNHVSIWSTEKKEIIDNLSHNQKVEGLVFSPDGKHLATFTHDNVVIWHRNPESNHYERIQSLTIKESIISITFDNEGLLLSIIARDFVKDISPVYIWSWKKSNNLVQLKFKPFIISATFSADTRYVALGASNNLSSNQNIYLWEWKLTKNQIVPDIKLLSGASIGGGVIVKFHPTKPLLATIQGTSSDPSARVWHVPEYREVWRAIHAPGTIRGMAFNNEGSHLLTIGHDFTDKTTLYSWNLKDRSIGNQFLPQKSVRNLAFSKNDHYIATVNHNTLLVWKNGRQNKPIAGPMNHDKVDGYGLHKVIFSPDEQYIATLSGKKVWVWEWHPKNKPGKLIALLKHSEPVSAMVFSADNTQIAIANGKNISLWDWQSNDPEDQFITALEHPAMVADLAFQTPSGNLVSIAKDHIIRIWRHETNAKVISEYRIDTNLSGLSDNRTKSFPVAFSHDGQFLAGRTKYAHDTRIWHVSNGKTLIKLQSEKSQINQGSFSPDFLAFSSNGKYLVTKSNNTIARLWDIKSGLEVSVIHRKESIHSIAISSDGKHMAISNTSEETIEVVSLFLQDLIKNVCARLTEHSLHSSDWVSYIGNGEQKQTCSASRIDKFNQRYFYR